MTYEEYRRWIILGFPDITRGPLLDLVAGSFAGGTAVPFTYPLDLVRTKLAYQDLQRVWISRFIPWCRCCQETNAGGSGFSSSCILYVNPKRDREYRSPCDYLGHGTHTASIAVGSVVRNVPGFFGLGRGNARGGAPSARLAVFKTCWGKDLGGVCTEADILAAFDDALRDGVDVILASFGSPPPLSPFFESSVDIGAFHAAERGVSVVFSSGNDGPDPGVFQNVAPWAISVAASTIDRSFPTRVVIDDNFTFMGQSLIFQEITGTLASATTFFNGGICKWENWTKKLANGTIILCFSTVGPIQFIEEAQAAAIRAKASALIFAASPTKQLAGEVDIIQTICVDILQGTRIMNYLSHSPSFIS